MHAIRLHGEDALIQRQRAVRAIVQAPFRLRGFGLVQQLFDAVAFVRIARQCGDQRVDLGRGRLQLSRQIKRGGSGRIVARRQIRTRLVQGGLPGQRQGLLRVAAIRIQRGRRLEQLACTAAVLRTQTPFLQCFAAVVEQLLDLGFRPERVGQWLPENRQHHRQQRDAQGNPAPCARAVPATRHPPPQIQPQPLAERFQCLSTALPPVLHANKLTGRRRLRFVAVSARRPVIRVCVPHPRPVARPVCPATWRAGRSR
ncbi:hypothetical protein D3C71_1237520 [compost metagenome]